MNKKILFFFMIIILFTTYCSVSFGDYTYGSYHYDTMDGHLYFQDIQLKINPSVLEMPYFLVTEDSDYGIYVLASDKPIYLQSRFTMYGYMYYYYNDITHWFPFQCNDSYSRNLLATRNISDYHTGSSLGILNDSIVYSNYDVTYSDGSIAHANDCISVREPSVSNIEDITNLDTDVVCIDSFDYYDQDIYLLTYDDNQDSPTSLKGLYPEKEILLNRDSSYFMKDFSIGDNSIYWVPLAELGLKWKAGNNYSFKFALHTPAPDIEGLDYTYTYISDRINFTMNVDVPPDKVEDANDQIDKLVEAYRHQETLNVMKEQTETSKGILSSIGNILSYINPLSPNFFAYKLMELLIDGLKSLFIPADHFFDTFFADLKGWFEDRLGFLFYPFSLIIDVLSRLLTINFSEPTIHIPDISEPSTNEILIHSVDYNLNSILEQGSFKLMHDIYLILVDAIIIFGLVNLAKSKFNEVTEK